MEGKYHGMHHPLQLCGGNLEKKLLLGGGGGGGWGVEGSAMFILVVGNFVWVGEGSCDFEMKIKFA